MYRLGLRRFLGVYELRLALPEGDCWETKAAEFLANRALTWGIGRRSLAAQLKLCPTQTGAQDDIQQETRSGSLFLACAEQRT